MAEKPIILVFTTAYKPFVGGAELAIQEIATRLKDKYDFIILTARLRRASRKEEIYTEGTVIRLGIGTPIIDKLLLPFFAFFAARKIINQHKRVVLWSVMISYASISAYFVKIFYNHIPFVLTIQEGNREWEKFPSKLWWHIFCKTKLINHITAISNFLKDRAREKGYKGKISIVPNGVDEKLLTLSTKRSDRQMADGPQIIFSTSRLVYKNGIDIVLDACAKLKDKFNFKLILAGDGEESQKLKLQSQRLGIEDRMEFLGGVQHQQLQEYYAKADIFVRPSRSEGLGISFLEAMAAGLVTIGTPVGGIPDFLEDGKTGFFAKLEDAENLANVLRKVFTLSAEEKNNIIKNAKSEIEKRFLWKNIAIQMDNIFLSELKINQ
ncbi:MAG: glycosyltransferase family 4 protein [Patescibacteria group bacterium]